MSGTMKRLVQVDGSKLMVGDIVKISGYNYRILTQPMIVKHHYYSPRWSFDALLLVPDNTQVDKYYRFPIKQSTDVPWLLVQD